MKTTKTTFKNVKINQQFVFIPISPVILIKVNENGFKTSSTAKSSFGKSTVNFDKAGPDETVFI